MCAAIRGEGVRFAPITIKSILCVAPASKIPSGRKSVPATYSGLAARFVLVGISSFSFLTLSSRMVRCHSVNCSAAQADGPQAAGPNSATGIGGTMCRSTSFAW